MNSSVIKVENLSKQYRLGQIGTGSLAHDINRFWHQLMGKQDPYLKIGETNDRVVKGDTDYVWALKDINFEVRQGEVLGIIGRNGAGKSTLLKILSRTTSPSTGSVKIKGRVASLLEVGTGFHPELTGRENIFLNGAILGMTKKEITRKFDEIVDFAGVERYIDTPVKRYSSGMYVRLAFGVAAHLEPEILIVDEVLAVGDAEFQKKALGKMKDVSNKEGRTVLFVSHNMAAISQLCDRGILLTNGEIEYADEIENVLKFYFSKGITNDELPPVEKFRNYNIKESPVEIKSVYIEGYRKQFPEISIKDAIQICVEVDVKRTIKNANITFDFHNADGNKIALAFSWDDNFYLNLDSGIHLIKVAIAELNFTPNTYFLSVGINQSDNTAAWDGVTLYPFCRVENNDTVRFFTHRRWGAIHLSGLSWEITTI